MNKVVGKVLVRETGQGIPNVVVALFDRDLQAPSPASGVPPTSQPPPEVGVGERLGSVLTGGDGAFELSFDVSLFAAGDPEKRPDLVLAVLAPEDSRGLDQPVPPPPAQRLLVFSNIARQDAGQHEAYVLRIARDQLDRLAIPYGSAPAPRLELSVLAAWDARDALRTALRTRRRQTVDRARARKGRARTLFNRLSAVRDGLRDSPFFVGRGHSPADAHAAAIDAGVRHMERYHHSMSFRLTEGEAGDLGLVFHDGHVEGDVQSATVFDVIRRRYGRSLSKARSLVDACRDRDVVAGAFVDHHEAPPQVLPALPGDVANGPPEAQVLERVLGQIRELETEAVLPAAVRPDVARIRSELDALELAGGPADAVALHDFNTLQVAFKHVWMEAFDESLRSEAEALYDAYVQHVEDWGQTTLPLIETAAEEGDLQRFIEALRGDTEQCLDPVPAVVSLMFGQVTEELWNSFSPDQQATVSSNAERAQEAGASGDAETVIFITKAMQATIFSNPQGSLRRLQRLMTGLAARLSQPYAFHVFVPNTYNYGILTTYRQRWEPLAYQAGDLVATIPLAPGETRKFTQKLSVRKARSEREMEKSLSTRREEAAQTTRADAEIVRKASSGTNFKASAQGSFSVGIVSLSGTTDFAHNQAEESAEVKKDFREAVVKAAQEYSRERTIEVTTSSNEDLESTTSGELSNPNNEITVTYLFYELQRRYRISEHLHKLTPVILVAQEVPAPHQIDEAWLLAHDWILRRVLLDDSFKDALDLLNDSFSGDELGVEVKRANWQAQRDLVEKLESSLTQQLSTRDVLRDALVRNVGDISGGETSLAQDIATGLATGGLSLIFGSTEPSQAELRKANRKALDMALGWSDQKVAEIQQKLKGSLDALQHATDGLTQALERQVNRHTSIDRLRVHVKENILHYMQAIWAHEPADQRFFRLYDRDVMWMPAPPAHVHVEADEVVLEPDHQDGLRPPIIGGGRAGGVEIPLAPPEITQETRKLVEVADLDTLLGFKGNYLMFPLKEPSYLTTFMMQEFVDDYFGVRDPDPFGSYTTEELVEYIECAYHHQSTTDEERTALRDALVERLSSPRRDSEEVIVPTGKLFIEALPGEHPLLEDFKLLHRVMDVAKVRSEVRAAELENLRRAARLIAGEREDPDIDKRVLVEGPVAALEPV